MLEEEDVKLDLDEIDSEDSWREYWWEVIQDNSE